MAIEKDRFTELLLGDKVLKQDSTSRVSGTVY